jgi:hypothetical protein
MPVSALLQKNLALPVIGVPAEMMLLLNNLG